MNDSNDIQALRAKLHGTRGREYWRSLEAVAETPEFKEFLHREFPQNASEWLDPVGRRGFLKLMGASLALAGVSACTRQPSEDIVPYVRQPEELVPGKPLFFATAMPFAGSGVGLLVESHEGRPTKIEGNPDHPSSLGATDLFAQAAILGLYDPDRSQTITHLGEIRSFDAFVRGNAAGSRRAGRLAGRRHPDSERDGGVADARRADRRVPRPLPAGEVGAVGAVRPSQRPRRQPARVR